jgi:hypothetical protein
MKRKRQELTLNGKKREKVNDRNDRGVECGGKWGRTTEDFQGNWEKCEVKWIGEKKNRIC